MKEAALASPPRPPEGGAFRCTYFESSLRSSKYGRLVRAYAASRRHMKLVSGGNADGADAAVFVCAHQPGAAHGAQSIRLTSCLRRVHTTDRVPTDIYATQV